MSSQTIRLAEELFDCVQGPIRHDVHVGGKSIGYRSYVIIGPTVHDLDKWMEKTLRQLASMGGKRLFWRLPTKIETRTVTGDKFILRTRILVLDEEGNEVYSKRSTAEGTEAPCLTSEE